MMIGLVMDFIRLGTKGLVFVVLRILEILENTFRENLCLLVRFPQTTKINEINCFIYHLFSKDHNVKKKKQEKITQFLFFDAV